MSKKLTPSRISKALRFRTVERYVKLRNGLRSQKTNGLTSSDASLSEILQLSSSPTDISDHLSVLYAETLCADPKLIVELGVRGGMSTFALESAARERQSFLLSVDIDDCAKVSDYEKWAFVKEDDVAFADRFPAWCETHKLNPKINVLFIDTSHLYKHTVQEIEKWFPLVAENGIVFFHDTNMREIYRRIDGSLGHGWKNDRGVIQAIEEYFNTTFDESRNFTTVEGDWIIRHWANCSGLTMLEKIER